MGLDALLENLTIDQSSRQIWVDFPTGYIWAWNFAIGKSSEAAHILNFYPQGGEIELIFTLRTAVSKMGQFSRFPYWAWNLPSGQSARNCTYRYILFLPQGVEIELIFAIRAAVSEILAHFQNCHIWAWNMSSGQIPEVSKITCF